LPADTAAELTNILNDTNEIQTKLPTNNIMGSSDKSDIDDEIIAIKTKTDNLPADTGATLTEILNDTNEIQIKLPTGNIMGSSVKTNKDDEIDAIKAKTDNLPADTDAQLALIFDDTNTIRGKLPTDNIMGSAVLTSKDDEIDAILSDTDEIQGKLPNDYIMGSVVQTPKDNAIDSIQAKTNNLPADTNAVLTAIQSDVTSILGYVVKILGLSMHNTKITNIVRNVSNKATSFDLIGYTDNTMVTPVVTIHFSSTWVNDLLTEQTAVE